MRIRRSKYGNRKTEAHGLLFDSKLEARRYTELLLLQSAGEISGLERQVPVRLEVNGTLVCTWKVDHAYRRNCATVWEESKGKMTPEALNKIKLARALFPHQTIEIYKEGGVVLAPQIKGGNVRMIEIWKGK
jgi:hypothetical protein